MTDSTAPPSEVPNESQPTAPPGQEDPAPVTEARPEGSLASRALGALPTTLVLLALGALGLYGHHTGWTIPARGPASAAPAEDWCEAHNVPQSRCLACNPALAGANPNDWCKEHGVPESKCTVCHPEILTGQAAADWCREHGVPESQCVSCHPELAVRGDAPPPSNGRQVTWKDEALRLVNARNCQIHLAYVQFASPEAFEKADVALEQVHERPMSALVEALAEVSYDQTRVTRVATRVPGILAWVGAEVGQEVKPGQVLALLDAQDVGRAKASLLTALTELDLQIRRHARIQAAASTGLRTAAETNEAVATLRKARVELFNAQQAIQNLGLPCDLEDLKSLDEAELAERVRFLGLPKHLLERLPASAKSANLIPLRAALGGVVVERAVVVGEVLKGAESAFVVADTSKMWIEAAVPQDEARLLTIGQTLSFRPETGRSVTRGRVSWLSTQVDDRTRTVLARAVVENPARDLRANVFGRARITVRESPKAIAVPSEAVHWEGCCHVVFVRVSDQIFQPRKVVVGVRQRDHTEIRVGLAEGEVVATSGSHVLKSDVLKSRLGAGCADD